MPYVAPPRRAINLSAGLVNQLNAALANVAQMNGVAVNPAPNVNAGAGVPPPPPIAPPVAPPIAPPMPLQTGGALVMPHQNLSNNAATVQQQLLQLQQQISQLQQILLLQQPAPQIPLPQTQPIILTAYRAQQASFPASVQAPTLSSTGTSQTPADTVSKEMTELGF